MKTYTSYQNDIPRIINNSLADNVTWATEMVNDSIRYLISKYFLNERSYTTTTVSGTQFYNLPPQVKKIINVTVNIGNVLWQPKECPTREFWDALNVISFTQDFPSYFFVYNGQLGIYPKPATTGNVITMNYKTRITDLSMADVTQTTATATATTVSAGTTITTTAAAFTNWMAGNWIRIPFSSSNATNGDNQWYQIDVVNSASLVTLKNPYTGASVTGANFTVGEVPILPEDYQDLPLYRMAIIYYTTRFPDPIRAQQYQQLWDIGEAKLNEEFGSKTSSVILTDVDSPVINPNLFPRTVS